MRDLLTPVVAAYAKHSMPVLRADAHLTVIDAANKGYMKWRANPIQRGNPDYVSDMISEEFYLGLMWSRINNDRASRTASNLGVTGFWI